MPLQWLTFKSLECTGGLLAHRSQRTRYAIASQAAKRMIDRNTDIIQRTRTHLALCAPELSEHDRALIVRSHALLFVKVAIDRFWFYRASPDAVR
ncbi:MAG: hypothetical protein ACRCWJ_19960, partial [Casimicrobium sp.]